MAILSAVAASLAQEQTPFPEPVDIPKFFFEALDFAGVTPDSTRLDFYLQVPYQMLTFTKHENVFDAIYDVTLDIYDSTEALVTEKLWSEEVETKEYNTTISDITGKMSQKSISLKPGNYSISIQVRDNETKKVAHLRRNMFVRSFPDTAFAISDLLLINQMTQEGQKTVIVPNVSGNINDSQKGISVFFEAYNPHHADSAIFLVRVKNLRGDTAATDTVVRYAGHPRNSEFLTIEGNKFVSGDYAIEVQGKLLRKDTATAWSRAASRNINVRTKGLPVPLKDLDKAIDEMVYITDNSVIDDLKKTAPEKKRKAFLDFWRRRNPAADSESNDLMEEYYRRVDYANTNFSYYQEGWRTDRGMVYILYGPPDNLERHPFDMDSKPYEVWMYYNLNKQFVFVDLTGFGDYRLSQNNLYR